MATKYLDYAGLQRVVENIDKKYAPIAALIFKGSVEDIAHLPALNTVKSGWMYNIQVGGGTTSDFIEGAGHIIGDGENVAAVELITGYVAVAAPAATDDPKALGWYEVNGTPVVVTPAAGDDPSALGLYEKSGDIYVLTTDTSVDISKTYYDVEFKLSTDRIPAAGSYYYTASTVMKWDILGGVFDLEGKYLELGTEFPQGPASSMVDGRAFLYLGDDKKVYIVVASPSGRPADNGYFEGTFTKITDTSSIVNPSQVPVYVVDTTVAAKYVEVTPATADPSAEGLYEEDGSAPGTYIPTADTSVVPGKQYYAKVDTYKRSTDQTVQLGTDYFSGVFVASTDTTVDADKVYYTEEALYKKGGIYIYNATTHEWSIQSGGGADDLVPITTAEIDDLFI